MLTAVEFWATLNPWPHHRDLSRRSAGPGSLKLHACDPSTNTAPSTPPELVTNLAASRPRPKSRPVSITWIPFLLAPVVVDHRPLQCLGRRSPARFRHTHPPLLVRAPPRASPCLARSTSVSRVPRACSTAFPRLKPTPGVPDLANSGELEPHAAAELCSGDSAAAFRAPTDPSRQISSQRLRLDRDLVYPEPSDPDPAVLI